MPSRNSASGLVRLVLPAKNRRAARPLPAFPEIPSNLLGFCLPYIQCGGVHEDARTQERLLVGLHELLHWWLGDAFLSRGMRLAMIKIWAGIRACAEGRMPQKLEVPIRPRRDGGLLANAFATVINIAEGMVPVHEVFAISVSLHLVEKFGVMSAAETDAFRSAYKRTYDGIVNFTVLYDRFEQVVKQYGYVVASDIAFKSLCTNVPASICHEILELATDSRDGEWDGFFAIVHSDPDFIEWYHNVTREIDILTTPKSDTSEAHNAARFMSFYLKDFPFAPFIFRFDRNAWRIGADIEILEIAETFELGQILIPNQALYPPPDAAYVWLWYESMRQQLATGIGLQCPFWRPDMPEYCCGNLHPDRREDLEGLLAHTHGPGSWQPRGCLSRQHRTG